MCCRIGFCKGKVPSRRTSNHLQHPTTFLSVTEAVAYFLMSRPKESSHPRQSRWTMIKLRLAERTSVQSLALRMWILIIRYSRVANIFRHHRANKGHPPRESEYGRATAPQSHLTQIDIRKRTESALAVAPFITYLSHKTSRRLWPTLHGIDYG